MAKTLNVSEEHAPGERTVQSQNPSPIASSLLRGLTAGKISPSDRWRHYLCVGWSLFCGFLSRRYFLAGLP
jgi:hypothetical protein